MKKLGVAVGVVLALVVAGLAYVWFSGGSGEPSAEVTAPPVTTRAEVPPTAEVPAETAPVPETEVSPGTAPTPETTPRKTTTTSVVAEPAAAPDEGSDEQPGAVVYRIDKEQSSVRFELDEVLGGNPKRVVGVTSEVAGEILIDFDDPPASVLGDVVINVRTLETDSSVRDRAIRGQILGSASDENEFANFRATGVEGLPDRVEVGDPVALTITGDLMLSGVTRSVVFEAEVTLTSPDRLEVYGAAGVLRSDFGLDMPTSGAVVDDEVLLVVELVAVPADR